MYYQFPDLETFNQWHNALCSTLNYPEIENGRIITSAYTKAFEKDGIWVAFIEPEYANGLTPIELTFDNEKPI